MSDSFERIHYEDVLCWDPQYHAPVQFRRAQITSTYLPHDVETVLDVGCGNGILTNLLAQRSLAVGIDRGLKPLRWVQAPCYQADIVALPFADSSFDAVVATEVIEHLPVMVLEQSLAEMVRVTRRYMLITVPYRENRSFKRVRCPECSCEFDPNYHMRRFEMADFQRLFSAWDTVSLVRVEGILPEQVAWLAPTLKTLRARMQREQHFRQRSAICPQCGYMHIKPPAQAASEREQVSQQPLRSLVRRIWPRQTVYQWWVALYVKRG